MLVRKQLERLVLVSLIVCATALTSCGGGESRGTEGAESVSLRLGAMPSMDYLPLVVADHMGYADSLGIDLELVTFYSAQDRDAAFRAGQLDGTVIDYTGALLQGAKGVELAIVTALDGTFYLMSHPEIATIADLKGRRIGVSRHTVVDFVTDVLLSSSGIRPEMIEKVEIPKIPLRMEMLQAGEMSASVFPDPYASMGQGRGFNRLASSADLGIGLTCLICTSSALAQKGETIHKLIQAYDRAVAYMQTTPRAEWSHLLVSAAGVPEEWANTMELPDYQMHRKPIEADLMRAEQWLKEQGLVPESFVAAELVYQGETTTSDDHAQSH